MKSQDLFGRTNQGENYDKYRPKYPTEFFETILKHQNSRQNYLDVACGTGQMLFKLNSHFKLAVGSELSEKQLSVVQSKIVQNQSYSNVKSIRSDANNLEVTLKDSGLPKYYDLITVGQALHWFNVENFLEDISKNVMTQDENSRFAVAGYYWDGFDIQINNEVISGKANFEEYYNEIKEFYDFDRENLFSNYKYYNFHKYLQKVEEKTIVEKDSFELEDFIKYLKTSSAYNSLVELKGKEPSFVDPTETLSHKINDQVNTYIKENKLVVNTSFNILRRTQYFMKIFKRI